MPRNHVHVIHGSHDVFEFWNDYGDDKHQPEWKCKVCSELACIQCPLYYDSELVAPCIGFNWYDGITIKIDGKDKRVRKSGLGWPK